ncbi:hypothetical protein O4J56_13745 [Nocardiopsis sp. RSe5-2]|uniref:Uncharacterized protein n=1 Tax=Nocardiopsis endophytica TaxID=3018445 RepID=A0ABT4U5D9_9ACTN|nr:hypothetical protein [Nocardiopsis endophytica]MDA2811699.1 hypothetical protein [Nocardiopsis endophytica]
MHSSQAELVWQGRIHLGDEPGVYGDAAYSGLAMELPLTLAKTDPNGPDTTTLRLRTQDVATFGGYPGHAITVILYEEDQPNHFTETILSSALLTSADNNKVDIPVDLSGAALPARVSVRVRVDTEVPPGLYDDFVVVRLENKSPQFTFVASLGFTA